MQTLICVISMEFLSLSRRRSYARNVPAVKSAEKRMFSRAKVDCVAYNYNYNFFDEKHALMMALKFQNFVGEPSPRPN